MKSYKYLVVLFCLSQAFLAHANSDKRLDHFLSLSLEDLMSLETTIASATKQTTTKAPAVVTLITSEDIKATGATNIVDILQSVPGIYVRMSQFGFRPLIHFRGGKANQTLLMVNGTPMKDLMWGFGIFWKGLPVSMIDRVEIIRGPGSALFGADASTGVINVITKTAGKMSGSEAGVRAGSFNTKTAWMQHGSNWNGFDIGLTANVYSTDGSNPFIASDGQTKKDQDNLTNVSLAPGNAKFGWRSEDIRFSMAKDNWRLHADYMRHSDLEIGLTGAGVLDPVTRAGDSRYNVDLFYKNDQLSSEWIVDAELRYQHLDYTSGDGFQERPPGYTDASGTYPDGVINHMKSAERRLFFEAKGLYSGNDGHALLIGAGYTFEDLYFVEQFINSGTGPDGNPITAGDPLVDVSDTPYAFAPEKMRKISHVFLQDIWDINDDWEFTAGARYDHYSDFGGTLNPRLALVWQSTDKLTTKLLYGQAFRAPSYQELFSITSYSLPNADLDPEMSHTVDLSFSYAANNDLQLALNIFNFKHMDIIRTVDVGLGKRQYQNTGEHSIRGIELEANWQASHDLRFASNYTTREQGNSSFRAVQEPAWEAYLRADWSFSPNWNWNLQTNWVGKRLRRSNDSRPPVTDYALTDTTLRYIDVKNWEFAVSIRNLFDVDAREYTGASIVDDLPLPERSIYLEMIYQF